MVKSYFKIAVRNLLRNKVFSFINVAGLSIGLACCMLILLYTKDEATFDGFHEKKHNLYRLTCKVTEQDGKEEKFGIASMIQGEGFKREIPEIEEIVRVNPWQVIVKKEAETFNEEIVWAEENFFSVFSFPLVAGDVKTVLKDLNSIVLTEEMAKKYFGTTDVIGKTLEIEIENKFQPFVVTGIAKQCPQNSSIQFGMLLSFNKYRQMNPDNHWFNLGFPSFFVMSPNADLKAVEAKMAKVFEVQAKDQLEQEKKMGFTGIFTFGVQPFLDIHLDNSYRGHGIPNASNPIYSYILIGIAAFILLIACINFVNLTIAQSLKRAKEIGLRKVIGGQRKQLIVQFLGESFLLCAIAFAIAFILAEVSLPIFNDLINKQLSLEYLFDGQLALSLFSLLLITGFSAGFYPALVLSGFSPAQALYNRTKFAGKNYLSKSLVVVQFALAIFLIISTFFVYNQFNYLINKDLGYNDKNLVEIRVGKDWNKKYNEVFKNEFTKIKGVVSVAPRMGGFWITGSRANDRKIDVTMEHIDENYLSLLGLPMVAGRNFSKDFPSDTSQSVLVNQAYIEAAGFAGDPIGKTIDFINGKDTLLTIIGVVKNYHYESLKEKIRPQFFSYNNTKMPFGMFYLRISPYQIPQTIQAIEATYRKLAPYRPFIYNFRDELNRKNYEAERKWKDLVSFSASVTVFISCIGLFGLTLLSAEQRKKEIGVRKVLGASVLQITTLLSRDFMRLVMIAFVIAIPMAWYAMDKWLADFAYKTDLAWWVFALAGGGAAALALATVSWQSIRAALANPVKSLRSE
jgi:putative ABC transport system permease protein